MSSLRDTRQPDQENEDLDDIVSDTTANAAELSGARESNAGDDFHFLWTVRTILQLLSPSSHLTGVTIEGVSKLDNSLIAQDDLLLGVDLTEYYSGNNIQAARKVIFSQLKYSTRHPPTAWTTARLCARRSARKNDSVIRRLATIASASLRIADAATVRANLIIRLVSNQPAAVATVKAIEEVQKILAQRSISHVRQLTPLLTAPSQIEINALQQAANLSSQEFIVFLSVLDFSQCGASSRALLRIETLKEIGLSSLSPGEELRRLYDLVRDLAGPGQEDYIITRNDVLAALELATDASIFPAPPKIEDPQPSLDTEDAHTVADFILANRGHHIIVHGPAGIGKTTTLTQLKGLLPAGAEMFQYDCFGGGAYLDLGQERHRAEDCFVQLANEFAIRLGTPFFLRRITDPIDVGRVFTNRVKRAAELLGPDGLLVIILDAADNAVTAARQLGSHCFVPDLRRLEVPSNCCIVYSTRTHRRELVDEDASLPDLALKGFSENTTIQFTQARISGANDSLGVEVHRISAGVPRFASYLLSQLSSDREAADNGPDNLLERLRQLAPHVLEDVFDGIVTRADYALADNAVPHRIEGALPPLLHDETDKRSLINLVVLARPVTLEDYAAFAGLEIQRAEHFCRALYPGLVLDERTLRFRDEDFETYLRAKFSEAEQAEARRDLSEKLLMKCAENQYAATHVADYLLAAKRWTEAINLATEGPEPDVIPDEVTRLHVRLKRFASGLSACAATRSFAIAATLLIKAAEARRTSETVLELVQKHPDLAALYGDVERLGALYMRKHEEALQSGQRRSESWLGAAHMRVAAMYARRPEFHDMARDHLDAANAWLRIRRNLPEHERHSWNIDDEDVASEAEAVFHLAGPKAATRYLLRWGPIEAVRRAARQAIHQLRYSLNNAMAEAFIEEAEKGMPRRLRTWGPAYLVSCLWAEGIRIPPQTLDKIAERMNRAVAREWRSNFRLSGLNNTMWDSAGWLATFIEALVIAKLPVERTMRFINALMPPRPEHGPSGHDLSRWELTLRFELLRARLQDQVLTVDDLMPEPWKEQLAEKAQSQHTKPSSSGRSPDKPRVDDDDLQRFRTIIGKLFPAYELWAETVTRSCTVAEIRDRMRVIVAGSSKWSQYEAEALSFRSRCKIAWESLSNCVDLDTTGRLGAVALLELMAANAEQSSKVGTVDAWIGFADLAVTITATRNTALELLEKVGARVDGEAMPARERWDALMRCARIALPYSKELCQDFYRRGIEAAEDVDDESLPLITSLSSLARSLTGHGTEAQRQQLAAALRTIAEEYRFRFNDENTTPWDEILQAISALDAQVGLSTCYHWDRLNVRRINLSLPTVLAEAIRSHQLEPVAGLALLSLSPGDWEDQVERYGPDTRFGASVAYREALLALHQRGQSSAPVLNAALSEVSERLCRDFGSLSRKRIISEFVKWADINGISAPALEKLREVANFCETLPEEKSGYTSDPEWESKWEARQARQRTQLEELLAVARTGDLSGFWDGISEAKVLDYENGVTAYVHTLAEYISHDQRPVLVQKLLVQAPDSNGGVYVRLARELVAKWQTNALVTRAADETVRQLLTQNLRSVVHHFEDLVWIARTSVEELLGIYLLALAQSMPEWGSHPLFLAFQHISQNLTDDQRWPTVEMAAQHLLTKVEAAMPPPPDLAADTPHAVAGLLFSLCGHIDAHVRWDALHGGRFLSRVTPGDLWAAFIPLTVATEAPTGFSHHGEKHDDFRWMTARVYALLLIERVADETPAALRCYVKDLQNHLFDASFPHAQVRELARRALLRVSAAFPSDLDDQTKQQIKNVSQNAG